MKFRDPIFLLLFAVIPLLAAFVAGRRRPARIKFPALAELRHALPASSGKLRHLPLALRCAALVLMAAALARPVRGIAHTKVFSEGIDIMLAIDVSSSMDARDMSGDLRVNRLDAVKQVLDRFIPERKNDRIGVVAFARYAYTQAPLTLDHELLVDLVDRLKIVPRGGDEDGTAIGSAIITCVARLKDSKAKGKVIILLTDGMNNFGEVSPESAAEVAKALSIRMYTIGAGTKGLAPYPVMIFGQWRMTRVQADIDEESLKRIAGTTGGRYFRAQDEKALAQIYQQINTLEKVKIEEEKFTEFRELFSYALIPALLLFVAEMVVGRTVMRRLP